MISLLDVNTYAGMAREYINEENKNKVAELLPSIEAKCVDKLEVLRKLEDRANELGSDNAWNRYESASEAYGYAEELRGLLQDFIEDYADWDDMDWQLQDIEDKTGREFYYRLERAQW